MHLIPLQISTSDYEKPPIFRIHRKSLLFLFYGSFNFTVENFLASLFQCRHNGTSKINLRKKTIQFILYDSKAKLSLINFSRKQLFSAFQSDQTFCSLFGKCICTDEFTCKKNYKLKPFIGPIETNVLAKTKSQIKFRMSQVSSHAYTLSLN